MSKEQYLNKPVPSEAIDVQQPFADEKIFMLGLLRFLVNSEGIVTFNLKTEEQVLEKLPRHLLTL
jgi:hypothetical protein